MFILSEELNEDDFQKEIDRIFKELTRQLAPHEDLINEHLANSFIATATSDAVQALARSILGDMLRKHEDEVKFNSFHVDPYRLTEIYSNFETSNAPQETTVSRHNPF